MIDRPAYLDPLALLIRDPRPLDVAEEVVCVDGEVERVVAFEGDGVGSIGGGGVADLCTSGRRKRTEEGQRRRRGEKWGREASAP